MKVSRVCVWRHLFAQYFFPPHAQQCHVSLNCDASRGLITLCGIQRLPRHREPFFPRILQFWNHFSISGCFLVFSNASKLFRLSHIDLNPIHLRLRFITGFLQSMKKWNDSQSEMLSKSRQSAFVQKSCLYVRAFTSACLNAALWGNFIQASVTQVVKKKKEKS